jgi:hypothetical protein
MNTKNTEDSLAAGRWGGQFDRKRNSVAYKVHPFTLRYLRANGKWKYKALFPVRGEVSNRERELRL